MILVYAAVEGVEAVGLWYQRRWAEYLTFIVTASLLPVEVYELANRLSPLKILAFVINVAVVAYLLYAKRLFGLRGGARADEEIRERDVGWEALERSAPEASPGVRSAKLRRMPRRSGRDREGRGAGGPSVRVVAADGDRRRMLVDGLEAAVVDRADPTHLDFPYMRWIADVLDVGWRAGHAAARGPRRRRRLRAAALPGRHPTRLALRGLRERPRRPRRAGHRARPARRARAARAPGRRPRPARRPPGAQRRRRGHRRLLRAPSSPPT